MNRITQNVAIGALAGGLLGFWIGARKKLSKGKQILVTLAGIGSGAGLGYGAARLQERLVDRRLKANMITDLANKYPELHRVSGGAYPEPVGMDSVLRGTRMTSAGKVKWAKCSVPDFPQGSKLDQWTVLQRNTENLSRRPIVTDSAEAHRAVLADMGQLPQEELVGLYLDNRGRVLGTTVVSRGTSNQTVANPADIMRPALLSGASRFILAHNHPSGNPAPSPEDVAFTRRVKEAAHVIGIPMLDSLIITTNGYASLRDLGIIS